jgi:hypothetical protein
VIIPVKPASDSGGCPRSLTDHQIEDEYFLLYYQFIKHAFGLQSFTSTLKSVRLRLYFDQFPDTRDTAKRFTNYIHDLQDNFFSKTPLVTLSKFCFSSRSQIGGLLYDFRIRFIFFNYLFIITIP